MWIRIADYIQKTRDLKVDYHILQTFLTRLAGYALGFLTGVLIARGLGVSGRGDYGVLMALAGLVVQFGNFGLHSANTYYALEDRSRIHSILYNAIFISGTIGLVVAAVFFSLYAFLPSIGKFDRELLFCVVVGVPFALSSVFFLNLLVGLGKVRAFNICDFLQHALFFSVVVVLFLSDELTVFRLVFFWCLLQVLLSVLSFFLLKPQGRGSFSLPLLGGMLQYGFLVYCIELFAFFVLRFDLFFISYFQGSVATGYYVIAQSLANIAYMFSSVIGNLLFPNFIAEKQYRDRRVVLYSGIAFSSVLLIFLLAYPFLSFFVEKIYGGEFLPAVTPALILIAGMAFYAVGNIVVAYILSHGKDVRVCWLWGIAAIINIVCNVFVIPIYGIVGAAWVTFGVYLFVFIFNIIFASRYFQERKETESGNRSRG